MRNSKKRITLNKAEWRFVLHALNKLRNALVAEGCHTDTIDWTTYNRHKELFTEIVNKLNLELGRS
jgi:hypothetical protein